LDLKKISKKNKPVVVVVWLGVLTVVVVGLGVLTVVVVGLGELPVVVVWLGDLPDDKQESICWTFEAKNVRIWINFPLFIEK
jgi:hypothetical protein